MDIVHNCEHEMYMKKKNTVFTDRTIAGMLFSSTTIVPAWLSVLNKVREMIGDSGVRGSGDYCSPRKGGLTSRQLG